MRCTILAVTAAALTLPLALSGPSEAKTAFQNWAQGRGVYVSSKDHPPGGVQAFLPGGPYYPAVPPGPGYYGDVPPPPPGYGYGYDGPDY